MLAMTGVMPAPPLLRVGAIESVSVRSSVPPFTRVQVLPLAASQSVKAVTKSALAGFTPSIEPEMKGVVSEAVLVE